MKVLVIYDDGHDYGEFEYFSQFNRINAKGIKDEIRDQIASRYIEVTDWYRIDD